MKLRLAFDDVLLEPKFSHITSRKDVDLSSVVMGIDSKLPIIAAPMDTVASPEMTKALAEVGAIGMIHRFLTIEETVNQWEVSKGFSPILSVGLNDWDKLEELTSRGCNRVLLDVAHGSQLQVVKWVNEFKSKYQNSYLMVGNFSTGQQILDFKLHMKGSSVDAWRIGIGGGSLCVTRGVTGCGMPTLASIMDCHAAGITNLVADGGIRNSGDAMKALAAGASSVMLGSVLSATTESPGEEIRTPDLYNYRPYNSKQYNIIRGEITHKKFRGSASKDSYAVQGKLQDYISPEGESTLVPYKGSVKPILKQLEGGIRSGFTYIGASNLKEAWNNAEFMQISGSGHKEGTPHGLSKS